MPDLVGEVIIPEDEEIVHLTPHATKMHELRNELVTALWQGIDEGVFNAKGCDAVPAETADGNILMTIIFTDCGNELQTMQLSWLLYHAFAENYKNLYSCHTQVNGTGVVFALYEYAPKAEGKSEDNGNN